MIFRVEGKNAVVISWPRNYKPKISPSRKIFIESLKYKKEQVEKTFDILWKTRETSESIAVFKNNIELYYNIHGKADFVFQIDSTKTILVFPFRYDFLITLQWLHLII